MQESITLRPTHEVASLALWRFAPIQVDAGRQVMSFSWLAFPAELANDWSELDLLSRLSAEI